MFSPRLVVLLLVSWCLPVASFAQSTFGGVVGVVKDPGQGTIAGAEVTLKGLDDGSEHDGTTNTDGGFEFVNIKAGRYELVVRAPGFADFKVTALQVEARQTVREDPTAPGSGE